MVTKQVISSKNDLDLWPESQAPKTVKTWWKEEPKIKEIRKEITMTEAPASFNIKFILSGYECQFTVRGEHDAEVLTRAKQAIAAVKVLGAEPVRIVVSKPNGDSNDKAKDEKSYLCPACKVEGQQVNLTSKKNGKAFHSLKCPQCNEFIPGTFRWS